MEIFKPILCGLICTFALSGCASFKMLNARMPLPQRVYIYSGTRLDWAAFNENDAALTKYKVTPPRYPLVDFPFSLTFDTLFLPLAICAEVFN
jgi:uncharacterized protein YceK